MTGLSSGEETCRESKEPKGEGTSKAPTSSEEVANVPPGIRSSESSRS